MSSIKIYIGIILGVFVSIFIIHADNILNVSSVNVDKSNMTNIHGNTINTALDYLYERASYILECP